LYNLPLKRTVKELWDAFMEARSGMYEPTMKAYIGARTRFFLFFKPDELIGRLTPDRMRAWKEYLLAHGRFVPATVTGTIEKVKAVFNWAKSQKWLTDSPLDGVGAGSYRNEDNDRFITQGQYRLLMDACPCQEWRVIITLARIGGLHPNEIKSLRWTDIGRTKEDRFRAVNSKMRHNPKLYERDVPLFPEIAKELNQLRLGNEEREFVINRSPYDWSAQFHRIADRAGLDRIPRPFDNMRASRATEVCNEYGAKRESVWLGHSEKTAMKYYLMVTDDDYAIAAGRKTQRLGQAVS
jgi:integrase